MSDSFFHQSLSPPQQTASLKSRKTRTAQPPPPPAPAASARTIHATNSAAPFYYGNVPPRSSAPPPPPPRKQRQSHATTSHSSGSTAAAAATPFYTTSSTSTNNRTAGGYSASGASYYGTPAPAAYANNGSATMTTSSSFANTKTGDATTNHEWNTNATNNTRTTTSSDWYSAAPQPQQLQSQYTPSQPQPGYTDYTQPSSFSTSTFDTNASELMEGSIGTNAQEFSTFLLPQQPTATMQSSSNIMDDEDDEAPLLEELGVNLPHIFLKTKAVVLPFSKFGMQAQQVLHEDDNDLAGPLVFALLLGGELLLSGKLQFSYIYGFCSLGCLFLTLVLNFMSPALPVSIWTVASILGYALLPVNILAVCQILLVDLVRLEKAGRVLGLLTICWCTVASTRLLEQKCGMRAQRYLLAYPIALLYSAFVMITIF